MAGVDVGVLPVLLSVMDCKVEILCFDETDSTKKCQYLRSACSVHALISCIVSFNPHNDSGMNESLRSFILSLRKLGHQKPKAVSLVEPDFKPREY